jgi:hypothetical protein
VRSSSVGAIPTGCGEDIRWIRDVDRLHTLLATYGDDALHRAFTRGLAEQAIGAEYIAHYLAEGVTTPTPIGGETGRLPFDAPSVPAPAAPRGGRVQAAAGARAAGRSAWVCSACTQNNEVRHVMVKSSWGPDGGNPRSTRQGRSHHRTHP